MNTKRHRRKTCQDVIDRLRYMAPTDYQYLYGEQKKLMNTLDVPFLDVFETTYLSPHCKFALINKTCESLLLGIIILNSFFSHCIFETQTICSKNYTYRYNFNLMSLFHSVGEMNYQIPGTKYKWQK